MNANNYMTRLCNKCHGCLSKEVMCLHLSILIIKTSSATKTSIKCDMLINVIGKDYDPTY